MNRRDFLKTSGALAGLHAVRGLPGVMQDTAIVVDATDSIASAPAAMWAVRELQAALQAKGAGAQVFSNTTGKSVGGRSIIVAGGKSPVARQILSAAHAAMPSSAEALSLVPHNSAGGPAVLATGADVRGLVYAVLELADRVKYADSVDNALDLQRTVAEAAGNAIRSCARCFESELEDKPWFYDRGHWVEYLSMLAAHRFNRFNLTFGLGYNDARNIPDSYFYFAYPFLIDVPGYHVRAAGLPDAERDRNLEMLRFISDETTARGLQFNLALWSHAYEWPNRDTNYRIEGLTAETHAPYCRDALAALLESCPNITGLSFRMHGESGIPDGRYDFWKTLFDGIKAAGRPIDIDQHAKATDQRHVAIGLATGNRVSMATKFWAEHLGLPYHQAAIRELELQPIRPGEPQNAATTRRFLRYGYGDYLRDGRKFGIIHRVWPGTQRHLLWGDPVMAAAYGRAFGFSGSLGVELLEPLSFKGRMGSGKPGGRTAYADKSLEPKYDWQKFEYQYRVWGRLTYNPESEADGWRRYLRREFKDAAEAAEAALAAASRVLPTITTAHGASASNNSYWPEMYTNMPIVDPKRARPYSDTPDPKRFGTVSPFDPQLFSTVDECAEALLQGTHLAKYTPLDVAQWLDDMSAAASEHRARALARATWEASPPLRRLIADVAIQAGTGRFFAHKFRSGVLWSVYERTGDRAALTEAVTAYRAARQAWAAMAEGAKAVYVSDVTYGPNSNLRGHWIDRIAGIDADLADMEERLTGANSAVPAGNASADSAAVRSAIQIVLTRRQRPSFAAPHTPPRDFEPGRPVEIAWTLGYADGRTVDLHYRHADQSQRWQTTEMAWRDRAYRGVIPAEYTRSPHPLLYYFEVHDPAGSTIYPGLGADLSNQPYFVMRSRIAESTSERR